MIFFLTCVLLNNLNDSFLIPIGFHQSELLLKHLKPLQTTVVVEGEEREVAGEVEVTADLNSSSLEMCKVSNHSLSNHLHLPVNNLDSSPKLHQPKLQAQVRTFQ